MNQLKTIDAEFADASQRLERLANTLTSEQWQQRPENGWSAAECVAHLNLTSEAYLPLLEDALNEARALPEPQGRYQYGFIGWLLWRSSGPPARIKTKTAPAFVPGADVPRDALLARFDELQAVQREVVQKCDGLAIDKVLLTSAFNARLRYNLFACLAILARHQQRHLWQAEQAVSAEAS